MQLNTRTSQRRRSQGRRPRAISCATALLGAIVRTQELTERDRIFLSRLKHACEFKVGIIDTATYQQRTDELAQTLKGLESLGAQLEVLYYRCLSDRNPGVRATLTEEARAITRQILNHSEATEPIKLEAKLTFLYLDGTEANLAATHHLGLSRMRASMFSDHAEGMLQGYRQAMSRLADWEASSNEALKNAHELGHPILIGEAITVVLSVRMGQLLDQRLDALCHDKVFRIPETAKSKVLQDIASALAINELNGTVEGRLRVNKLKADFLELVGDLVGAKELAARIYPEAEAMGFANIAEWAMEFLDERTLLMQFERDLARFKQTDDDISFANMRDDELQGFARDTLLSLGLPPGRLKVIEQCCQSLREVARERCRWCRHLGMLEEQRPTIDPATAYSVLPNQRCVCEKFHYKIAIVTSDAQALMGAFKRMYCESCKYRTPKQA